MVLFSAAASIFLTSFKQSLNGRDGFLDVLAEQPGFLAYIVGGKSQALTLGGLADAAA